MVNIRAALPAALPWRCELCGGSFRALDKADATYECDGCGTAGRLTRGARTKLGGPA